MPIYVVFPEKMHQQNRQNEEKEGEFFGMTICNFSLVYSVEDSTLIPMFDSFCFLLFLKGSPKFSPNRYRKFLCSRSRDLFQRWTIQKSLLQFTLIGSHME